MNKQSQKLENEISKSLIELEQHIEFLKKYLHDQKWTTDQMNWADLGSMQKVNHDLKETISFIKGE